MRMLCSVAFLALATLFGAGSARSEDKVLLPGDPPLTRDMVDKDIDSWERILDVKLTAAQRAQFERLRVNDWKGASKAWKDGYLKKHAVRVEEARLGEAERGRIRDDLQTGTLARMRGTANDPIYQFLLPLYDAQVLVPGNPALTPGDFDKEAAIAEWLLDLRPTAAQRREYRQCYLAEWKKQTKVWQTAILKSTREWYARLVKSSPAERAAERVIEQPANLKRFRTSMAEDDKWLLAAFESAHKPGSGGNPILVKGDPPLTQDMVNAYFDYFEWSCDLTLAGGWSDGRLKAVQQLIVADWAKADAGRDAFLADLTWWNETFPKLTDAERKRAKITTKRAYLRHVEKTAGDDERRAAWVKGVTADIQLEGRLEEQRHAAVMGIIKNIAGPEYEYRYVFDSRTSRYEYRYVPK